MWKCMVCHTAAASSWQPLCSTKSQSWTSDQKVKGEGGSPEKVNKLWGERRFLGSEQKGRAISNCGLRDCLQMTMSVLHRFV